MIDTHCHLTKLNEDEMYAHLRMLKWEGKVSDVITFPIDIPSNITLTDRFTPEKKECEKVHFGIGIHPLHVKKAGDDPSVDGPRVFEQIFNAVNKNFCCVGETGLDYLKGHKFADLQISWLHEHIQFAFFAKKPLVLHIRDGNDPALGNAFFDALLALNYYNRMEMLPLGGVVHCYNGPVSFADEFVKLGFKIGVGGLFTKSKEVANRIKYIPIEYMVLETDAPYLKPEGAEWDFPFNTPLNIPFIAKELADLKGLPLSVIDEVTTQNAKEVFKI